MDAGVHLPQLPLLGGEVTAGRIRETALAAGRCGFAAVSANDHVVFGAPWLDGPGVLASVAGLGMDLMTTVALPVLRGPVQLASSLATLDVLCGGRLVAGVGPGSSRADYEVAGVPFDERWARFDESLPLLRHLLLGEPREAPPRWYPSPPGWPWAERRIPLWVAAWASVRGLRRVARWGDGWLASAYNTDPDRFRASRETLAEELSALGRPPDLPHALVTMWTLVTDHPGDALAAVAATTGRDPDVLRDRLCIGSAEQCVDLLSRLAEAGCRRVHFWPLADEAEQVERLAADVLPRVSGARSGTAP